MKWISVNTRKPVLGQKCYCYYVLKRYDGTLSKGTRLLYYQTYLYDRRRNLFFEKDDDWFDLGYGRSYWPVTHWMPEPEPPQSKELQ